MSDVVSCLLPPMRFDRAVDGLLGAGQRLARERGGRHIVAAAAPLDDAVRAAVSARADGVLAADNASLSEYQPEACLAALEALCRLSGADVVLLGSDTYSQELTPRLAHRLGGSSAGDAQKLSLHEGRIRVTRSVYGGKAMAVIEARLFPAVIWLRARAMAPAEAGAGCEVQRVAVAVPDALPTRITERHAEARDGVRLEDADIIISGGRGLGGPEPFEQLKDLAAAVGGQVAASRAACDSGWVPPSWQVGQTGKKVAPELYLAIAISGASQHIMGIADAKVIAAVNTDSDAPIFKHCRYGLVADYRNVVGPLREKLSALLT